MILADTPIAWLHPTELTEMTTPRYLLRTTRPTIATSYAYVNPIVALAIGALLGGEHFTAAKAAACGLTVLGVVIVTATRARRASSSVARPRKDARARNDPGPAHGPADPVRRP